MKTCTNINNPIEQNGILYIVPTPIGNLNDITQRAIATLNDVDLIAAESIKHSYILLKHFNIKTPIISIHKHNEKKQTINLINILKKRKHIALISNAGTPLINDPGYNLIENCCNYNIKIVPLPGPCAAITALTASGLPTNRFCYEGFLSHKKKIRCKQLINLKKETRTIIIYESPHRILDTLQNIIKCIGSKRYVVIAKELTKYWETIHRGTAHEILEWIKYEKIRQKGEFVILIKGYNNSKNQTVSDQVLHTLHLLQKILPLKQANSITAKIHGVKKNLLYQSMLNHQNSDKS